MSTPIEVKVFRQIPNTHNHLLTIIIFTLESLKAEGTVSVRMERKGNTVFSWSAVKDNGIWNVTGKGATLPDGTPVSEEARITYPFTLENAFNEGLKTMISQALAKERPR